MFYFEVAMMAGCSEILSLHVPSLLTGAESHAKCEYVASSKRHRMYTYDTEEDKVEAAYHANVLYGWRAHA